MTPFVLATFRDTERAARTKTAMLDNCRRDRAMAVSLLGKEDFTQQELSDALDAMIARRLSLPAYINDTYQVIVEEVKATEGYPELVHLSVRRLDRDVIRDWRDLQEIKNQLVGEECEGVEIFPAESRLVDSANQYHLWVFKDPEVRIPFGFKERYVTDVSLATTRQRPREKDSADSGQTE